MTRYLATFGGAAYEETVGRTLQIATKTIGVNTVLVYDDVWLRAHPFYELNRWLFELPGVRGLCWFAWKPLVILDALGRMADGDVLLYIDGDTYPIADLTPLYERCVADGGVMLFAAQGCSNRQWVKADCWVTMASSVVDIPGRNAVQADSQHAVARFTLFQRGHWHVQQFLMEWLTYCINPLSTTFQPSKLRGEIAGFEQHRTEQAILSLLSHKYGYHLYRESCQFGNAELAAHGTDSWYPQLFVQEGARSADTHTGSRYRNV